MSPRFKRPLVGAAGQGLSLGNEPPQVPGAHYAPGLGPFTSCLFAGWGPACMASPSGCAGLQVGNKTEQQRFKKGGMKGDLVLYDSLSWLMGSLEGLPACQEPQTSWQRAASAAKPGSPQPLQPLL